MPGQTYNGKETARIQFLNRFKKPIEEYDSIKRAVEALTGTTPSSYYRDLAPFFLFLDEDPDAVIKRRRTQLKKDDGESDFYERKTKVYKKFLEEQKAYTGRGSGGIVGRIQGFFNNNSRRYALDLGDMTYSEERRTPKFAPDLDMAREIYGYADVCRDRLILALARIGPDPVDIAKLHFGDLPAEPFTYFQRARSKTKKIWHGVTTPDIAVELAAYRKLQGNPPGTALIFRSRESVVSEVAGELVRQPSYLKANGVSRVIADLINRAGYGEVKGFKPTAFRDAFEDACIDANIPEKIKEALMGHTGDISHQYGSAKKVKEKCEEAMRQVYPFICLNQSMVNSTSLTGFSVEDVAEIKEWVKHKAEWRALLQLAKQGDLVNVNDPELQRKLKDKGVNT